MPVKKMYANLYEELKSLNENVDVIFSFEPFTCSVCLANYGAGEGFIVRDCFHIFCLKCIEIHIKQSTDAEIICPYVDAEYKCECLLQEREVKNIVSEAVYHDYLTRSLRIAKQKLQNIVNCSTADCSGWFIFDPNAKNFHCSQCGKNNCLSCMDIHESDERCDEYLAKNTACALSISSGYVKNSEILNRDELFDLFHNFELMCNLCSTVCDINSGIMVRNCLHYFCIICMKEYVAQRQNSEIKCPSCECFIQVHEVHKFISEQFSPCKSLPTDHKMKYIFNCLSKDCSGWCIIENQITQFCCNLCEKTNCISCEAIHEFETCDDYLKNISSRSASEGKEISTASAYLDLVIIDDCSVIVSNIEPFECAICFVEYDTGEGVILRDCLHTFCLECLKNHIIHSTDVEVKCPYMDDQYSCVSLLQEREIKNLVSPDDYNKYLTRSLQFAEQAIQNTFHCLTPNCIGWCVVEDNVTEFICCSCEKANCLSCKIIHEGQTCDEYLKSTTAYKITEANNLSKEALNEMIANGTAMLCSTCQSVIEKISGCDSIQCTACKTLLCWATRGPRWGPGGQGDTSGGCQCGVAGKCHPNCQNCH